MENQSKKIIALLGPTNTGKTHVALEKMLEFKTGIFGLPLRLLAREVYDKCVDKVGIEKVGELQARVADEIKTTFKSKYTQEVSLEEALTLESLMIYAKQATGEKFLINPNG